MSVPSSSTCHNNKYNKHHCNKKLVESKDSISYATRSIKMGKKTKKTKQMDARGYATRTSSNSNKQLSASSTGNVSSSSVTVSTKVHANILHLLGTDVATSNAVKETSEVVGSNNATVFDKKTVKKLGSLIPYLSGLKFSEDQIVAALSALHMSDVGTDNSNLKEEAALDWLCLNLATEDLPGRFVDVDVKKSIQEQESERKITLISQHDDEVSSNNLVILFIHCLFDFVACCLLDNDVHSHGAACCLVKFDVNIKRRAIW